MRLPLHDEALFGIFHHVGRDFAGVVFFQYFDHNLVGQRIGQPGLAAGELV